MAYLNFLEEQENKTAVFTYGRNNPPTIGHEKLFDKTVAVAKEHGTKAHIYTSHTQDSRKNPLTSEHKVALIKHAYPAAHVASSNKEMPSMLHIAKHLHAQGHKHLVMVAGSDRVDEYHKKLHQYNGTHEGALYNFKTIKVVSAGHRDPDAEGAEGISGTKLRSHAIAGNKEKFKSGLMSKLSNQHKEEVYNKTRQTLKVKEIFDPHLKISKYQWGEKEGTDYMKKMTPGESALTKNKKTKDVREQYVAGTIFKIGQMVELKNGSIGSIKYRGSNYVTVTLKEGKEEKCWLEDVHELDQHTIAMLGFTSFRNFNRETKIPVLLMNEEQRKILVEENQQLEFDGIQTKNLDMCPGAYKQFKKDIETIRAGKHLGEPIGHDPDVLPAKGQPPEAALRPQEIKQPRPIQMSSSDALRQVTTGQTLKPERLRQMQFRQYTGL